MELHKIAGQVLDYSEISGTAKLTFGENWESVESVDLIEIDDDEVVVCAEPDGYAEDY